MNILILTKGNYSDYEIISAFSSDNREKAENAVKVLENIGCSSPRLFPMEVDADINLIDYILAGNKVFVVDMSRSGDVEFVHEDGNSITEIGSYRFIDFRWGKSCNLFSIVMLARDREQAIKAANEKRIELIALNRW